MQYKKSSNITTDDKVQNGEETADSEHQTNEEEEANSSCYYDKTKSFFDNLSCDGARYHSSESNTVTVWIIL